MGRGSSGGYGGGRRVRRTGGVSVGQIRRTFDMMDTAQYDNLTGAVKNLISPLDVFLAGGKYAKEYGEVVEQLQWADMPNTGVIGYFDGKNIAMNTEFADPTALNAAYDVAIKQGFHPSRGNKSAMEATAAHEYAHALTGWAAEKMGIGDRSDISAIHAASERIVKEAQARLGYKKQEDVAKRISGYAMSNQAETIAEAFSDVYCNGTNAKRESRTIVNIVNRHMGGRHNFY